MHLLRCLTQGLAVERLVTETAVHDLTDRPPCTHNLIGASRANNLSTSLVQRSNHRLASLDGERSPIAGQQGLDGSRKVATLSVSNIKEFCQTQRVGPVAHPDTTSLELLDDALRLGNVIESRRCQDVLHHTRVCADGVLIDALEDLGTLGGGQHRVWSSVQHPGIMQDTTSRCAVGAHSKQLTDGDRVFGSRHDPRQHRVRADDFLCNRLADHTVGTVEVSQDVDLIQPFNLAFGNLLCKPDVARALGRLNRVAGDVSSLLRNLSNLCRLWHLPSLSADLERASRPYSTTGSRSDCTSSSVARAETVRNLGSNTQPERQGGLVVLQLEVVLGQDTIPRLGFPLVLFSKITNIRRHAHQLVAQAPTHCHRLRIPGRETARHRRHTSARRIYRCRLGALDALKRHGQPAKYID